GAGGSGGGVHATTSITATNLTVDSNTAAHGGPGGHGQGGNGGPGNPSAASGDGGNGVGGSGGSGGDGAGLIVEGNGQIQVRYGTISSNHTGAGGGGGGATAG